MVIYIWIIGSPNSLYREFLMKNSSANLPVPGLTIQCQQTSKPHSGAADDIFLTVEVVLIAHTNSKFNTLCARGPVPELLFIMRPAQLSRFRPLRSLRIWFSSERCLLRTVRTSNAQGITEPGRQSGGAMRAVSAISAGIRSCSSPLAVRRANGIPHTPLEVSR